MINRVEREPEVVHGQGVCQKNRGWEKSTINESKPEIKRHYFIKPCRETSVATETKT